jgi:hypothetical protein
MQYSIGFKETNDISEWKAWRKHATNFQDILFCNP